MIATIATEDHRAGGTWNTTGISEMPQRALAH